MSMAARSTAHYLYSSNRFLCWVGARGPTRQQRECRILLLELSGALRGETSWKNRRGVGDPNYSCTETMLKHYQVESS